MQLEVFKIGKPKNVDLGMLSILFVAFILRFINLGYSDFQGDEIKALFLTPQGVSIGEFLLSQRKGPVQFLITFLIKFMDPYYTNQFLLRLPFAVAGFLSVYVFYKLIDLHFGKKIACYSSIFLATNGFFVAFSRIAQYQSFVILFGFMALYYLSLAASSERYKVRGIYLGFVCWAVSILSHYDGVFIFPVVLYLLYLWRIKNASQPNRWFFKTLTGAGVGLVLPLAAFYIPFVLYISKETLSYWTGRLTGEVSDKLSGSYYLFTVYQPIYVIHVYLLLFSASLLGLLVALMPTVLKKALARVKPIKTVVIATEEVYKEQIGLQKFFVLLFWFCIPFLFWELVVYIPGTHIYTYLISAFVLVAIGLSWIEEIFLGLTRFFRVFNSRLMVNALLVMLFTFISIQSYMVFVDHFKEYPWQEEKFFLWTFPMPTPIYHLSMFGFPYFRDWEGISNYISSHSAATAYSTNERKSISRHYIALEKDTDLAGFYVYIRHPQSFTNEITNEKVLYWTSKQPPVYTMSKGGTDLVNIYLMPGGTLAEIKSRGF